MPGRFNPLDPKQMNRFANSFRAMRKAQEPFERLHRQVMSEMVGVYYGENSAEQKANHVNLLELAFTTYLSLLAASPPQIQLDTQDFRLRAAGRKFQDYMNRHLATQPSIFCSIQQFIMASLSSMGIMEVGILDAGRQELYGQQFHLQEPFLETVLLQDFCHDMSATSWERSAWMSRRIRLDLEWAKSHPAFRNRDKIQEVTSKNQDQQTGNPNLQSLSTSHGTYQETYRQYTEVWRHYFVEDNLIVYTPAHDMEIVLLEHPWEGPPRGPYHRLYHRHVDGNTMPLPPAAAWLGLHKVANAAYRKLDRGAERQKRIGLTQGKNSEDASTISRLSDGEIGAVDRLEAVQEFEFGGVNPQLNGFFVQTVQLFKSMAGNLDVLAGQGTAADTATESTLMHRSANMRVDEMRRNIETAVKGVLEDYSWWHWTDPIRTYESEIHAGQYKTTVQLSPMQRTHDFFLHNFELQPYSLTKLAPAQRLQSILGLLNQVFMPALPIMQQQGVAMDWTKLLDLASRYGGVPELKDVLTSMERPDESQQDRSLDHVRQPSNTSRTINRTSQKNPQEEQQKMVASMMNQSTPRNQ